MALDFLKTSAQIIIFFFIWNFIKTRLAGSGDQAGRAASAMAFIG